MGRGKIIDEMVKDYKCCYACEMYSESRQTCLDFEPPEKCYIAEQTAIRLYDAGYRKVPEGAVVLTKYDFCCGCKYYGEPNGCNRWNGECANYERFMEMYDRLAELEDKIEDGRLVELPCKVGDKLYLVYSPFGDIDEWEITDIQIGNVNLFRLGIKGTDAYAAVLFKELGEYAFITKAEAEARLKELRGEE